MSVPIPSHLAHLPTDRRGLAVPWVNRWGPEQPAEIRWDTDAGWWGVFTPEDRTAGPDFTRQCMHRQRQSVIRGLCQVCARHVPWSRRRLVIGDLSVETVKPFGAVVTEPWLCQRCADFAVTVCPALIRRTRDEHLTVVEVTSKRQAQVVVSRGWVEGPAESRSRELHPVMWAKIQLVGAVR